MSATMQTPLREVYRDLVTELMVEDERLVCLDTDTGLFDPADFGPAAARYVNVGIAEHTLMGAAAGLAKEGRRPLAHTMAAFAASRALEAVKVDIAMTALPVFICATHAGVSAGPLGPTHHALEDLAVMRSLPNMRVIVPADEQSTRSLVRQALAADGPTYLRLGRGAAPAIDDVAPARLGEAQVLRTGGDITIVACGSYPVVAACAAADALERDRVPATVINVSTIKPLDVGTLAAAARETGGLVVTVEEHWASGGLGSAVAEALSELLPVHVQRVALPDAFVSEAGDQGYLLQAAGITAERVAARARDTLAHSKEVRR